MRWRRGAVAVGRREDEAIDSGVKIPERAKLLTKLVDLRVPILAGGHQTLLPATNADNSRSAIGTRAERRQRPIRRVAQLRRELARAGDAAERDERRLLDVLADRLARLGRIAFDVEQVVDDLEREAEVLRERAECAPIWSGDAPAVSAPAVADATNSAPVLPR